MYALNTTGTDTDTVLVYNSTMQTQDNQQSGSGVAGIIVGGIIGGLFAVVATDSGCSTFPEASTGQG